MKCFNHPDRDAVASCQKCGKGLCRECAEKYTPCMCDSCVEATQKAEQQEAQSREEQRKQKSKAALVDTRSEFITTAVIGIIFGFVFAVILINGDFDLPARVLAFGMGFCIPFGWKLLSYFQSFFPLTIFGSFFFWAIWIAVKAYLSIWLGIPAFIFQLIKTIIAQRKINKLD